MPSLAIIGTGIAGMTCAHYLQDRFSIQLFEKENYVGGHTNTVEVPEGELQIPVDTGFIVFNRQNYPGLIRLFSELEVEPMPTRMSFGVQDLDCGLEYAGQDLNSLFTQRRNLVSPAFWGMLRDILRFRQDGERLLAQVPAPGLSLRDFARERGYSRAFLTHYLVPMSSAIWSTAPDTMLQFPAVALVRFFKNHGLLGVRSHHQWYTVRGGSRVYRDRLIAPFRDRIAVNRSVQTVERTASGVVVTDHQGKRETFDYAIVATHADQALAMLAPPSASEQVLLSRFRYSFNHIQLHTDRSVMPKSRRAWAAWNYVVKTGADGARVAATHYWMNALQGVSQVRDYFVSVNAAEFLDPGQVLYERWYEHPIFDLAAIRAQENLDGLNHSGPVFFCGSYFGNGFHEDALVSALEVCRRLCPSTPGLS